METKKSTMKAHNATVTFTKKPTDTERINWLEKSLKEGVCFNFSNVSKCTVREDIDLWMSRDK